jgi:hypothetical protein
MPQYLVPTPEGEQPDLELAYLVVDGEMIPASEVTNPASLSVAIVEPNNAQGEEEARHEQ